MRLNDWEVRLRAVLACWRDRDFEWSTADCSNLICETTTALTAAPDKLADLRGRYHDAESAASLIRELGFENLGDLIASRWPEVPPAFAHRGDIGFCPGVTPMCLSIVMGPTVVCVNEKGRGLYSLPRTKLRRAFKVGWED